MILVKYSTRYHCTLMCVTGAPSVNSRYVVRYLLSLPPSNELKSILFEFKGEFYIPGAVRRNEVQKNALQTKPLQTHLQCGCDFMMNSVPANCFVVSSVFNIFCSTISNK